MKVQKFHRILPLVVAALCCAGSTGCGDDCAAGPGDAETSGPTLATSAATFVYGNARSSPNNDCTPFQGREPTSLTVDMVQVDPASAMSLFLTLCIPEPDAIADGSYALGFETSDAAVRLVDVFGRTPEGALYELDSGADGLDATVTFTGYCDDGAAPEGYAIALSGAVPMVSDDVGETASFGGPAVAVEPQLQP